MGTEIKIHNFDVLVNGKPVENPVHRFSIVVAAFVVAMMVTGIVIFLVLPLLGLGVLLIVGIVLLFVFWLLAWLLTPILVPLLAALGLFKWLTRD